MQSGNALLPCTVTRSQSYTATGVDCNGLPIIATATHTCTSSASNCDDAGNLATICALTMAHNETTSYINSVRQPCEIPNPE